MSQSLKAYHFDIAKTLASARRRTVPVRVAPQVIAAAAPVAEVIYARIRRDVVFGSLKPGKKGRSKGPNLLQQV